MMQELWTIYHAEIPEFLRKFANTPPMERLKHVGMNCGCEYTKFPLFEGLRPYSRFDHSMGVALIVWHFTQSMEQALAGLFHDVTIPAFAHVVDFLNGDHLLQESTEAGVSECLASSPEVMALLEEYDLMLEDVSDYHRYPIADNDSPALAADRLEYTLGNLFNYGFADLVQLRGFYEDLVVGRNERNEPELVFQTSEKAEKFALSALRTSRVYVADEDRFAMQALADLLRDAVERRVISRQDLWKTEPEILEKLSSAPVFKRMWGTFCGYSTILKAVERPESGYWVSIGAKKRWIDPYFQGKGRVSQWSTQVQEEAKVFLAQDFSCWISAE